MAELATNIEPAEILLSVNNIEVVYDEVILVLRGVSFRSSKRADCDLTGRQRCG